jgi:hypothetical protein
LPNVAATAIKVSTVTATLAATLIAKLCYDYATITAVLAATLAAILLQLLLQFPCEINSVMTNTIHEGLLQFEFFSYDFFHRKTFSRMDTLPLYEVLLQLLMRFLQYLLQRLMQILL